MPPCDARALSQERTPARVQGLGAFCHTHSFDWSGEYVVTADDNMTVTSGTATKATNREHFSCDLTFVTDGQQSCVVRLWSSVKTTETPIHQCHAPDEVEALHSLQPGSGDGRIRMLVAMENGLIQEHAMPLNDRVHQQGQTLGYSAADGQGNKAGMGMPSMAPDSEGGWGEGQLPIAISHDVATLRRTPRVTVKGLRHMDADDADGVVGGVLVDEGELWSLELTLQTMSKIALVNRSIGVDIIVHNNHPAVAPQVVEIDRDGLLPQECVQRLYQMFVETASMAAVTGAQQCLHMCCTMMLQVMVSQSHPSRRSRRHQY